MQGIETFFPLILDRSSSNFEDRQILQEYFFIYFVELHKFVMQNSKVFDSESLLFDVLILYIVVLLVS